LQAPPRTPWPRLFQHAPELSATGNSGWRFNSGVIVLEPCNCTFDLLMSGIHRICSYNGGDQGYLNEVFTWWHRLPRHANLLKYELDHRRLLLMDSQQSQQQGAAVHYLGIKPWMCYHDYDCNWDVPAMRRFASDVVVGAARPHPGTGSARCRRGRWRRWRGDARRRRRTSTGTQLSRTQGPLLH
jgi:hypothetical protein